MPCTHRPQGSWRGAQGNFSVCPAEGPSSWCHLGKREAIWMYLSQQQGVQEGM